MFCLVNNYCFLFFCKIVRFFVKLLYQNHILMQIEHILDKSKIISLFLYNSNNYLINGDHNTIYTNCDCVLYQYKPLHYNACVSCLQYFQLKEDKNRSLRLCWYEFYWLQPWILQFDTIVYSIECRNIHVHSNTKICID